MKEEYQNKLKSKLTYPSISVSYTHLVIEERLEREFDLELIATAPSVIYHCYLTDGSMIEIDNPAASVSYTHLEVYKRQA